MYGPQTRKQNKKLSGLLEKPGNLAVLFVRTLDFGSKGRKGVPVTEFGHLQFAAAGREAAPGAQIAARSAAVFREAVLSIELSEITRPL